MYEFRFDEKPPEKRSVDQLRGIEGARVRKTYTQPVVISEVKGLGDAGHRH
jgi:hypothetical protein